MPNVPHAARRLIIIFLLCRSPRDAFEFASDLARGVYKKDYNCLVFKFGRESFESERRTRGGGDQQARRILNLRSNQGRALIASETLKPYQPPNTLNMDQLAVPPTKLLGRHCEKEVS
jgi:hypothetical protein